jgi:hypothetical protein
LVNNVPAIGAPAAQVSWLLAQASLPIDIIEALGCRIDYDGVKLAGNVTRTTTIAFNPTMDAHAFIKVNSSSEIIEVFLADNGIDYIVPPICSAPGGIGAMLKATLNVVDVQILNGGSGYDPTTAKVAFVGGLPPANSNKSFLGCVRSLRVVEPGAGYDPATELVVMGGGAPTRQARARPVWGSDGRLTDIVLLDMGEGYTQVPEIGFMLPVGSPQPRLHAKVGVTMAEGTPASAALTIVAGVVTAVKLISPGDGYVSVPTVVIDPGGPLGSGFSARARMGVGRINVIAGGHGYQDGDPVTITPFFQAIFPSQDPPSTDQNQARPWGRFLALAFEQSVLSPVLSDPPVVL